LSHPDTLIVAAARGHAMHSGYIEGSVEWVQIFRNAYEKEANGKYPESLAEYLAILDKWIAERQSFLEIHGLKKNIMVNIASLCPKCNCTGEPKALTCKVCGYKFMDPDETLKEIREILQKKRIEIGELSRLLDCFEALDEWITKGGCLPKDWQKKSVTLEEGITSFNKTLDSVEKLNEAISNMPKDWQK
jgi:hypothetical protein